MLEVIVAYVNVCCRVALYKSLYSLYTQPEGVKHLTLMVTELHWELMLDRVLVREPEAVALCLGW